MSIKYGNKIICFLMKTIYMWVICVAVTIEWQGLWDLIESNIDNLDTKLSLSVLAITYACITRSTRALVSTPFILSVDQEDRFFEYELKSVRLYSKSFIRYIFVLSFILISCRKKLYLITNISSNILNLHKFFCCS